eukprot:COSAG01_NODE_3389_length_6151_cov_375.493225_6_plen_96_part_01
MPQHKFPRVFKAHSTNSAAHSMPQVSGTWLPCQPGLSTEYIHLTIMRPTKGGNTDIRCYIARLIVAIFLKLQESNFLLYATRFSIMRSLVKRLGMG